jgi:hypothetical protein
MKKILSLALLGASTSLFALYAEHASLYKDPRIMSMGGANVAVGGYSTSVFSNPAGLAQIKKEHGIVVDLLSIGMNYSPDAQDFVDDLNDVETDADINPNANTDLTNVLRKYSGEPFHIAINNYTSVSKNSDAFAWSVGLLAATEFNFMPHAEGGSQGLLATSSRGYGGVVLAAAKPYDTGYGRLDVGVGLKYVSQQSYEGVLDINDLLVDEDEDIADILENKYETKSSGVGIDLGVTYYPNFDQFWNLAVGMSIMNIGSLDMDDNYGGQPMTVNIGASISPEVSFLSHFKFAVDYVDMLEENKLRMYDGTASTVQYTDYDESDFMKRLRLGASLGVFDNSIISTTLNAGLYQGSPTYGLDFHLTVLRLTFASYEEQIGTGDTDIADRRYMGHLSISW